MIRYRTRREASHSRMTQPPSVRCLPELSITPRPSNHASGWAGPRQKDRERERQREREMKERETESEMKEREICLS